MLNSPWAKPVIPRQQGYLLTPTLDNLMPVDDDIRLLDKVLQGMDWSAWECQYDLRRGQPPIHPRLVAGTILFCLTRAFRSSRQMEEATRRRLDLIWFLEGRTIDHSTLCGFRNAFAEPLPELFKQVAREAARLRERAGATGVGVDGTRLRANSDRHGARTGASLERRLAEVAERREALLREWETADVLESCQAALEGAKTEPAALEAQLRALEGEREKLSVALAAARERDAVKQRKDGPRATAVRVPVTDPDAHLLPNKEGGFAPNYTAMVAVDLASGAILEAGIAEGGDEAGALAQTVTAAGACLQTPVTAVLADGNFATGANLEQFDGQQGRPVLYSPCAATVAPAAVRDDPSQPVPASRWDELPTSGRGKTKNRTLSREAFIYDAQSDCYFCPQGRRLSYVGCEQRATKNGERLARRRYASADCADCPLAPRCLGPGGRPRSVTRDPHQPCRDALAQRMSEASAKTLYGRRAPVVEGVFGVVKHVMGARGFLTRGREKVACEWRWICTAFNMLKILRRAPAGRPQTDARLVQRRLKPRRRFLAPIFAQLTSLCASWSMRMRVQWA